MQSKYSTKDVERFWGYVDKNISQVFYNGSRCWEWISGHTKAGYGRMSIRNRSTYMHRMSYELNVGIIPDNLLVLHHCDNPTCVNPAHLFLGTDQDNVTDKVKKGRGVTPKGEDHPKHKLTKEQVAEIRRRYARWGIGGEGSITLAREFGISSRQVIAIVRYENWVE